MWAKIQNALNIFLRGGTSTFSISEKFIIASVENELPASDRAILEEQINSISLVQRQHPGRLVVAYYQKRNKPNILPYSGYEYCLAEVHYKHENKTRKVRLVLHDGRLQSLEGAVPISQKSSFKIKKVCLHPQGFKSIAEKIDAEEHA